MELVATMHRPVALSLSLVSNFAHAWIAPILYQTIILWTEDQVLAFHHFSPINLALVKSLALNDLHTDILRKCDNVSHLIMGDSSRWDSWHDVMQSTWSGAKPQEIQMLFPYPWSCAPPAILFLQTLHTSNLATTIIIWIISLHVHGFNNSHIFKYGTQGGCGPVMPTCHSRGFSMAPRRFTCLFFTCLMMIEKLSHQLGMKAACRVFFTVVLAQV